MADIHSVIRNLKSKNHPEENLVLYRKLILDEAKRFALTEFSFDYLPLIEHVYDAGGEKEDAIPESFRDQYISLNRVVKDYLSGNKAVSVDDILMLRKQNHAAMELYTNAVDLFTADEYVLNRIEHRFVNGTELPDGYSDLDTTEKIMRYLAGFENEEQNLMIVSIVEQLPVRMTKNRFVETVRDRLGIYRESDAKAFRDVADTVRSTFGLKESEVSDAALQGLKAFDEKIQRIDPESLSAEEYDAMQASLGFFGEKINAGMDFGLILQDALNSFASVLLSDEAEPFEEEAVCREIISNMTASSDMPDNVDDLFDLSYEKCDLLEGIQEDTIQDLQNDLGFLNMLENQYHADFSELKLLSMLFSASAFGDEDELSDESEPLNSDEFSNELDRLSEEMYGKLKSVGKTYGRALMARIFSVLPPHFSTQEELEDYIYESLSGCANQAEKLGFLDILNSFTEE